MKYNISYSLEVDGEIVEHTLTKTEAIKKAKQYSLDSNDVYISWYRYSDGELGYLNKTGHEITGKPW